MKKRLFFALLVTVCAAGAFLVSCDKDDDEGVTCICTNWGEGHKKTEQCFNTGDFGVADCDSLGDVLSAQTGGDFECWQ